jgi:hypothetical protein
LLRISAIGLSLRLAKKIMHLYAACLLRQWPCGAIDTPLIEIGLREIGAKMAGKQVAIDIA